MKLKKFRKNKKRNTMLIIAVVVIVGLVVSNTLIKSHAYFKTTKSFNVIRGKIPNPGDVKLAILVGNEKTNTFPNKQDYKYVETKCNEDSHANISFDPNTWKLNIDGIDSKTICTIKFERKTEYEEEILKGSYPVIKDELIPVVIADNGVVTKANTKDEWYSYANSRWANAVILVNNPSKTYNDGDTILESDINAYFVWIPKYRYKLFNVEGNSISPQEIEIEFGISDTVDNNTTECKATNKSGDIGTCSNGMWMTHPAFTSLGVNGIWVGKFETGYKGTTTNFNVTAPEKVQVKPNLSSWRSINVSNMYNTSLNYKRNLDSHMMKNTEWGAMAYLTNSKYGRGNSEVTINSNSSFITGGTNITGYFSGSIGASTTNNYSGIYDISGCGFDMVMGNLNNMTAISGFTEEEIINLNNKYMNIYTVENTNYKILGDATGETRGWNDDTNEFVDSSLPWFDRGGGYFWSTGAGAFYFKSNNGSGTYDRSFRIVLSPTN